jgi:hypothetical protein
VVQSRDIKLNADLKRRTRGATNFIVGCQPRFAFLWLLISALKEFKGDGPKIAHIDGLVKEQVMP